MFRPPLVAFEMANRPLRVMKFGGTSMGDTGRICIAAAIGAKIVVDGARDASIVVVVSAMSGVTNRLIASATKAQSGNPARRGHDPSWPDALRKQAASKLTLGNTRFGKNGQGRQVQEQMGAILAEARRLYDGTAATPCSASSRLAPSIRFPEPGRKTFRARYVLPATLRGHGLVVKSESVEATRLIVTDSYHGGAEPLTNLTREHCEECLRPMLKEGAVPVVTGFIGSSEAGELTTLGRGGSDYSATILGAALAADEVIIWTDVDGVLTADPR